MTGHWDRDAVQTAHLQIPWLRPPNQRILPAIFVLCRPSLESCTKVGQAAGQSNFQTTLAEWLRFYSHTKESETQEKRHGRKCDEEENEGKKKETVRTGIVYISYTDLSKAPLTFFSFQKHRKPEFLTETKNHVRGVKLVSVHGPHRAWFNFKWASSVKALHNNFF